MKKNRWQISSQTFLSMSPFQQNRNLDFDPEFSINLECFFPQKTLKVKIITHDSNHHLIFYYTHNQLCVPLEKPLV